jgi:hypothetical protein
VKLSGAEASELIGDLARSDPRSVQQRGASYERHSRACSGHRGAAAIDLKAGIQYARPGDGERHPDPISARPALGMDGVGAGWNVP